MSELELAAYQGKDRRFIETVYLLLQNVGMVDKQKLYGFNVYQDQYTSISSPMIEDNPVWVRLRRFGLKDRDEHHLLIAISKQADIFLTCDRDFFNDDTGKGRRRSKLEQEFGIQIRRPSELIKELEG